MQISLSKSEKERGYLSRQLENLYNRYGGMLYGYLTESFGDHKKAEDYLIKIFLSMSEELEYSDFEAIDNWSGILKYTKQKVLFLNAMSVDQSLIDSKNIDYPINHKCFSYLSTEQREIFYASYYGIKTVEMIAAELNKPQDYVRKMLRTSVTIIKANHGH